MGACVLWPSLPFGGGQFNGCDSWVVWRGGPCVLFFSQFELPLCPSVAMGTWVLRQQSDPITAHSSDTHWNIRRALMDARHCSKHGGDRVNRTAQTPAITEFTLQGVYVRAGGVTQRNKWVHLFYLVWQKRRMLWRNIGEEGERKFSEDCLRGRELKF